MRHRIKTNRLHRFSSLRKATINALARSVIHHYSIKTTYTKAKAAAPEIEHLISLAKSDTLAARRQAYKVLLDHRLVSKLFGEVVQLFKARESGFTRILKIGIRRGDGALMALLEFTDLPKKEKKEKKEKIQATPHEHEHPPKEEEKHHLPKEEQSKPTQKKEPTKKFLGGLKGFFKKERDSL